ncbi:NifU family protein [Sneathiella sp. HT1-7]|uniref:NifU family protein n=1 Tax=Sneathiella sp. HT1-7 TaxID=2887192 RepID=UPI001D155A0C|nr:NifU family protein [Sneathiella sp. HT1-7]MCC3304174.1 NifU family protein [Sneathiella sp. HT1-7]
MFIQTKPGDTATELEFFPAEKVFESGPLAIVREQAAEKSPLAARLYAIDGVTAVTLKEESIVVAKAETADWSSLRTEIFGAIVAHFQSGDATVRETADDEALGEFDAEIIEQIKDLLSTRIVPAVTQSGGDVSFHNYKNGKLYLKFQGPAFSMLTGIQNMLRHYIPEITAVLDYRESLPKPGLKTAEGLAIQNLLEEKVNPSIAAHGGRITLVDLQKDRAYVRLDGGCQGCGMADVTLKQGVAVEIQKLVPSIAEVLDVTDHADGTNPYYQPS